MRVDPTGNNPQSQQVNETANRVKVTHTHHSKRGERARSGNEASPADAENAEISPRAREFAKAKEIASAAPDVREEKIAALKARIAEGRYAVDADEVANRMVDEHIKMSGMS